VIIAQHTSLRVGCVKLGIKFGLCKVDKLSFSFIFSLSNLSEVIASVISM
jgi:hypothetical protein